MRALAGVLVVVSLLLAACGGAGAPPTQPGPATSAPAATSAAPSPAGSPAGTPGQDDYDYGY